MKFPHPSPLFACAIALVMSGCAQNGKQGGLFASASSPPKSVIVSDFAAAPEVTATDNGFNTRLERRGGNFPILERRQRTLARVNDEIVATIIADVRTAGLDAQPGNESTLSFGDDALVVAGRLRPPEHKLASQVGFGPGRGNVDADMTLTRVSSARREQVFTFAADVQSGRKGPAGNAQSNAARNQTIAAILEAEKALPERLSPDVEAQARSLGRAIAERIVAYAKEHDWLEKPAAAEAPSTEQNVRLPDSRPAEKPVAANKPAAPKAMRPAARKPSPNRVDAPEDEEPPDTNVPEQDKQ
jgi:hypothetical protein